MVLFSFRGHNFTVDPQMFVDSVLGGVIVGVVVAFAGGPGWAQWGFALVGALVNGYQSKLR